MPTHIHIRMPSEAKRKPAQHDEHRRPAGWVAERVPKDEPHVANKNMALGRWIARAEANSGPKIAPGTGTRKSS
jgi:hypothetical protein